MKLSKKLRSSSSESIIKRFKNVHHNIEHKSGIVSEYIRRRMPLHFGGMSDPFQPIEKHYKTSYEVLRYLISIDYPIVISTRSTMVSSEPYLSLLKDAKALVMQFSFSTLKDELARKVEPFAPLPTELQKTIEKISKAGINATIRWQPYIPNFSENPEEFILKISQLGVKHLGFEHLKMPFMVYPKNRTGMLVKKQQLNYLPYDKKKPQKIQLRIQGQGGPGSDQRDEDTSRIVHTV